jgi:rhodanese-related sulfurtransferase
MPVKRVEPKAAAEMIRQGWTYVDVRSVGEFDGGHPPGAYNVPLLHAQPGRAMSANPDFVAVFMACFALDDAIILGCRSGVRSLRAATMLVEEGYTSLVDMRGGFGGERDPSGRVTCAGWQECGLLVEIAAQPGRSYEVLRAKIPR